MKTIYTLLIAMAVIICQTTQAALFTVSNLAGAPAQFNNIQAALTAATANDTLYVSGSALSYNVGNVDKGITIIGQGAYPGQGQVSTKMTGIVLSTGADGFSIMGCRVEGFSLNNNISNVSFLNCEIATTISCGGSNNWLFEGCEISGVIYTSTVNNLLIQNNIFVSTQSINNPGSIGPNYYGTATNVVIKNNVFYANGTAYHSIYNTPCCGFNPYLIQNNIFYAIENPEPFCNGCIFENNCTHLTGSGISNGGGNSGNINADPLFINLPGIGSQIYDPYYNLHLGSGSPCIGTGINGSDMGVYANPDRFNPYVLPPVPNIVSFNIFNSTVPVGGTLQYNAVIVK